MNKPLRYCFYKRFSLILLFSVVVASVIVIRVERMVLVRDLEHRGANIVQALSSATLEAIPSQDYTAMERYIKDIVQAGFVSSIAVFADDGAVLAGQPMPPDSHLLFVEHPIRRDHASYGTVQLAFSTAWIDSITWKIVYCAGAVVAVLHVVGLALINVVLNNTIYQPLNVLQQAIHEISEGNLTKKIELTGPQECNSIGESFNVMAARLADSFSQLKESRQHLELERQKLAAVVACMTEGLFVTDNDGVIVSFNESAARITGYSEKEAVGRPCGEIFQFTVSADARALNNVPNTDIHVETTLKTQDGRLLDVSVGSAVLLDSTGKSIGGVQTFRDISDEKKRHEFYCRTEKLAALGQLAAGVAHEINTPLGNIIGYASMIPQSDDVEKNHQRVSVIVEQARKCSEIVKGLLDYSRASISKLTEIDLNESVLAVVKVLQLQLKQKDAVLTLDLSQQPSMVLADSRKAEQLILNLVLNAIQAIDVGGEVHLRTWQDKEMAHLLVQDNGPGVPEELRCRIFDPFVTTKPVGEGTGLGLAICAGIIDELDGLLELIHTGSGAGFMISLPCYGGENDPAEWPAG
ncbi:MAG: PAS domain S-box protein [Proteobacteria bacterium]|nr:PAS domain S-box protein [Pseudomonadota bacterium]MBU1058755.1 PAS domain S-box protein [Pseudomonadota bacterium]